MQRTLFFTALSLLQLLSFSTADSSSSSVTAPASAISSTITSTTPNTSDSSTTGTASYAGPTPAASNAVHATGDFGYSYVGCWNETTYLPGGERAISGGSMDTSNTQTVESCLEFCHSNSYPVCGLEYGRECWGGHYLSTLSAELPSQNCSVGCVGNLTQFCGGFLTLTVYNTTSTKSATGAGVRELASAAGAVVLAAALGAAFSVF